MTAVANEVEYVARIHPREPTRGYVARVVLLSNSGYPKFDVTRGWYSIDKEIIPRLRSLLNHPADPHSRPVFQICTRAEALALEKAEEIAAAKATDPIPMPQTRERRIKKPARRVDPLPERLREDDAPTAEEVREAEQKRRPAYIETADPEDPEDAEFVVEEEEEDWGDDLAPTSAELEDEGPSTGMQRARAEVLAEKSEVEAVKKSPARKAAKKAKKRPRRKAKKG